MRRRRPFILAVVEWINDLMSSRGGQVLASAGLAVGLTMLVVGVVLLLLVAILGDEFKESLKSLFP